MKKRYYFSYIVSGYVDAESSDEVSNHIKTSPDVYVNKQALTIHRAGSTTS